MATWPGAEGFIDEYASYLSSNLAAKLTLLNTEYDDFELDAVTEIHKGEAELQNVQSWPVIFLIVEGSALNQASHSFMHQTLDINASILVLDQDSTQLRQKVYRYIRAMLELLMEAHAASSITWHPSFDGASNISYSPLFTDGETFMADAQLRIQVWKREET